MGACWARVSAPRPWTYIGRGSPDPARRLTGDLHPLDNICDRLVRPIAARVDSGILAESNSGPGGLGAKRMISV
jgi:hypothetical protein